MEIQFTLSEKDVAAFNEHDRPAAIKRGKVLGVAFCVVGIACCLAWPIWKTKLPLAIFLGVFLVLLAASVISGTIHDRRRRKAGTDPAPVETQTETKSDAKPFVLGTMKIEGDRLDVQDAYGTVELKLKSIKSIEVLDQHTFLRLRRRAYVIPRQGVVRGDYDAFVHELQQRWQA